MINNIVSFRDHLNIAQFLDQYIQVLYKNVLVHVSNSVHVQIEYLRINTQRVTD